MGIINERRRLILKEMAAGQGSDRVFDRPVSLEPSFTPFNLQVRRSSFFESLLGQTNDRHSPIGDRAEKKTSPLGFIRIKPSREDKNGSETAEQFLLSLHANQPVAFEVIGENSRIGFQVVLSKELISRTVPLVRAQLPSADVSEGKDLMGALSVAKAYRLRGSAFFVLSQITDQSLDPLRMLFGPLSDLEQGRRGVFQVLFTPIVHDWPDNMRRASRSPYDSSQSPFGDLPGLPKLVDRKISKPLFAVSLRLGATDRDLLSAMEQFLKQFDNNETGLIAIPGTYPVESLQARNTFVHGSILNLTELASFVHLPTAETLDIVSAIGQAIKSYPVPEEFQSSGPILGMNTHRGINKLVKHSLKLSNGHLYACGAPGSGKSELLLYLLLQRIINGDGCGLLDPHGRLLENDLLPRIPKDRIKDVVLIDPADIAYPVALNPLQHDGSKIAKEQIRADLMDFLQLLFEDSFGVNIQHSLNFALLTLLQRKDATILDLERIIIDKNWRANFLENIQDERIHTFWDMEYPLMEKRGIVTALTNKLSILTAPDSIIAPLLSSPESKINFLDIMNQKKIFLANLGHGRIGKKNSQLLGKLILSQFSVSAMMRQKEKQYPDFHIFVDELHELLSQSCAYILSATRKYGLHIIGANQSPSDLPGDILRHILNAAVLVAFNTDYPPDQMILERSFSRKVKAEALGNLNRGETYVKMGTSVFDMKTVKVPNPPAVNWTNEIISESRARYSRPENESHRTTQSKSVNTESKTASVRQKELFLSAQERLFLECLFQNPTLSVTSIYRNQKLSGYMGDKLKRMLKEKGLVEEMTTHLGSGSRIAKFLILTSKGFEALSPNLDSGKGGPMHRYWQSVIGLHAESTGYVAVIEELIPGTKESVDIGLRKDGNRLAVEISVTNRAEYELSNAIKCIGAEYSKLIFLFLDENKLKVFEELIRGHFTEEDLSKISIGLLYDFCRFF